MFKLLPCHRPASPEMKLSPNETIAVEPDPGTASDGFAGRITAPSSVAATAAATISPGLTCLFHVAQVLKFTARLPSGPVRRRTASNVSPTHSSCQPLASGICLMIELNVLVDDHAS